MSQPTPFSRLTTLPRTLREIAALARNGQVPDEIDQVALEQAARWIETVAALELAQMELGEGA